MIKLNQNGAVSSLALYCVLTTILSLVFIIFSIWAFAGRQDYKNNADAKISAAVTVADQEQTTKDNAAYAQESKSPLKTYTGPEAYGSLILQYPKTWSGYVDDSGSGTALVDGYFSPGVVPAIESQSSVFALRVQVINEEYSQELQTFTNTEQAGTITVNAYSLPKMPQIAGVEITGQVNGSTSDETMVVLPLRSETIEIWTQGTQYLSDFNTYILPNFSFSP
jgi:hypothetical protein